LIRPTPSAGLGTVGYPTATMRAEVLAWRADLVLWRSGRLGMEPARQRGIQGYKAQKRTKQCQEEPHESVEAQLMWITVGSDYSKYP